MLAKLRRLINSRRPPVVTVIPKCEAPPRPKCPMSTCLVCGREFAVGEEAHLTSGMVADLAVQVTALVCADCYGDEPRKAAAIVERARQIKGWEIWETRRDACRTARLVP